MGLANFLPKEILEEVFGYLSWAELSVAGLVCHRWHEVVSDLHIKRFPLTLVLERPNRMMNLELMPSRISKVHHLCVDVPTHTVLNEHFGQLLLDKFPHLEYIVLRREGEVLVEMLNTSQL